MKNKFLITFNMDRATTPEPIRSATEEFNYEENDATPKYKLCISYIANKHLNCGCMLGKIYSSLPLE